MNEQRMENFIPRVGWVAEMARQNQEEGANVMERVEG